MAERVFGDYDEGVLEKYKLTDEDIDYIKILDVVICDVWGKVEGQFKELKEKELLLPLIVRQTQIQRKV